MADSGLGAWRERLISVLHLFTSFALSLLYLAPAALLVLMIGSLSSTVAEITLRLVPVDWELPVLAALTLVSLPVATLLSRLCTHIQKKRVGALFGIVEATVPEPDDAPPLLRGLRYVLGREAWTTVLYSTVAGFTGLLSGGLTVLLVAYGTGGVVGGVLALAVTFLSDVSVQNTGLTTVLLCVLAGPPLVVGGLWAAPWLVRLDTGIMRRVLFDSPQVRVRRRLLELSDTRSRMVDAAEAERRRIERDLHDGAQQRLLALGAMLGTLEAVSDDPVVKEHARTCRAELKKALAELRALAREVQPALLVQDGLGPALEVVAERLGVRVKLDVTERRFSREIESALYSALCEALSYAVDRARASEVLVRVGAEGRRVVAEMSCDCAGAAAGGPAGPADPAAELAGLSGRIGALRGHVEVDGAPGRGTTVRMDLPCE